MKKYTIITMIAMLLIAGCSNKTPITEEQNPDQIVKSNETDLVNLEQPSSIYVCEPNLDVFYVTPNSGDFKDQDEVVVWDIEKKNSENIYYLFETESQDFEEFLVRYAKNTGFPGGQWSDVLTYTDDDNNDRKLVDIGLESQIWYTMIGTKMVLAQDFLGQKGCEGQNCIKTEEFLELLTCIQN